MILDKAGMASTEDLARLVALAQTNRWRLVCVGDPAQLPAVRRGGMFAPWCDTLPVHHLEEVRRFTNHWEADASLALRAGAPRAAVAYAEAGRLRTARPATLADQVGRQHDRLVARGHTVAITTASAGTARDINVEIQHRGNPTFSGPNVTLADDTVAFADDRIATRRNDPTLLTNNGGEVRNRHTWTVISVHRNGDLTVTDPDRGSVRLPAGYVARHVELGWATTGYGNQASPSTPASPSSNPSPPEPASTSPPRTPPATASIASRPGATHPEAGSAGVHGPPSRCAPAWTLSRQVRRQGDRSVAEGVARDFAVFSGLVGRQTRTGGHGHG